MDRRTVLAGLAASTLPLPALAQADRTLTPAAMRSDIALLRRAYETLHPGLYRYNSPAQMAARWDALAAACARPQTLAAFYLALSRHLATVMCGHSYANFYNQTKGVQAALFEAPRLPLEFVWLDGAMVVTRDAYATGIAPGSRILAIDGIPTSRILAGLMGVARADGHNDAKRRRLVAMQNEDRFETFDVFFPLLFGARDRWRVDIAAPDGRRRAAELRSVTPAERRARIVAVDAAGNPGWTMARRGRAAVLTMPGWALYDDKWDWQGWLDAELDRVVAERVPTLIVDLRGNEGGRDCGNLILARRITQAVPSIAWRRLVRYERLPAELRPYADTWDRSFDTLGVGARRVDDRFLELAIPEEDDAPIAPHPRPYAGRMIVLTEPQNSSATFNFADIVRRTRTGTLVGGPTGGNRRGLNGGRFYFFRLPETGLEADIPLIAYQPPTPQPDAGIVPDVRVEPTAASIATGRDIVMERALAL